MPRRQTVQQNVLTREVQWLILILTAARLSATSPHVMKDTLFHRLPRKDVMFTQHVLLTGSARSDVDCGRRCVETEACVMLTFQRSPVGPPGTCRLYGEGPSGAEEPQEAPGAHSYGRLEQEGVEESTECSGGYIRQCDRCLKTDAAKATYDRGKTWCREQQQGHLVMPRTQEDLQCVRSFAKTEGLDMIWIGAENRGAGDYMWNDGTLLPPTSPVWAEEQPATKDVLPCVLLVVSLDGIIKSSCTKSLATICQREL